MDFRVDFKYMNCELQDSDRTVSGSVSTDSEHTPVRVDSQDSQVSDGENVENRAWPRQNSVSMI